MRNFQPRNRIGKPSYSAIIENEYYKFTDKVEKKYNNQLQVKTDEFKKLLQKERVLFERKSEEKDCALYSIMINQVNQLIQAYENQQSLVDDHMKKKLKEFISLSQHAESIEVMKENLQNIHSESIDALKNQLQDEANKAQELLKRDHHEIETSLRNEILDLHKKIYETEFQLESSLARCEEQNEEVINLKSLLEVEMQRSQLSKDRICESDKHIKSLKSFTLEVSKQYKTLRQKYRNLKHEKDGLTNKLYQQNATFVKVQADYSAEYKILRDKAKNLEVSLNSEALARKKCQDKIDSLVRKINIDKSDQNTELSNSEIKLQSIEHLNANLEQEIVFREKQLEKLDKGHQIKLNQIAELEQSLTKIQDENKLLRKNMQSVNENHVKKVELLERLISDLKEKMQNEQCLREKLEDENKSMRRELRVERQLFKGKRKHSMSESIKKIP